MKQTVVTKVGAGCGALFAVVLTVANGDGSNAFSTPRAVAGVVALTLALPFVAYIGMLLRDAEAEHGWVAATAVAAGIAGITLKLASGAPELALHRAHVPDGTLLHKAVEEIAGGLTVLSLYPLAVFCAATAFVALRTRVLPRWLGAGAGLTAAALAVNGGFLGTSTVPGLLLFALWTLLASIHLLRNAGREPAHVGSVGYGAT